MQPVFETGTVTGNSSCRSTASMVYPEPLHNKMWPLMQSKNASGGRETQLDDPLPMRLKTYENTNSIGLQSCGTQSFGKLTPHTFVSPFERNAYTLPSATLDMNGFSINVHPERCFKMVGDDIYPSARGSSEMLRKDDHFSDADLQSKPYVAVHPSRSVMKNETEFSFAKPAELSDACILELLSKLAPDIDPNLRADPFEPVPLAETLSNSIH